MKFTGIKTGCEREINFFRPVAESRSLVMCISRIQAITRPCQCHLAKTQKYINFYIHHACSAHFSAVLLFIIIIIIIYFQNIHFLHSQLGLDILPDMKLLHTSMNTTHSECKPSSSISSFTNSLQVFLPLHAHLTPATTTFLQADTQSSPLIPYTCPNHLNLPRLTTSTTLWTPKRLYKSTLPFLSFSDTPHIHFTVLFRLCRFASFIAKVSVPCVNSTFWTHTLYIFPFMWYDVPRAVRIGDNSLNLAQAHLTLALAASSTHPPVLNVSPKYQNLGTHSNLYCLQYNWQMSEINWIFQNKKN